MESTLSPAASSVARTADAPLELLDLRWERVQLILRLARGGRDDQAVARSRLERADGTARVMAPTRAWVEDDSVFLRFNVMQGPGQVPLRPGRWTLTAGGPRPGSRGAAVPIVATPTLDPSAADMVFALGRTDYRVTPSIDPHSHRFTLTIRHDEHDAAAPARDRVERLRHETLKRIRSIRPALFRVVFLLARTVVRRNGRRILFTSDSRADLSGNLKLVYERMVERGLDREYELLTLFRPSITERRSLRDRLRMPWLLARADVIVLDDYQPVIYRVDVDRDVRIVQLWHASGPFKTVGYSRIGKEGGPAPWSRVHKNYTHAIVSSDIDVPYYAEAFGIPESRVIPTGVPRMDRYFDPDAAAAGRRAAHEAFPATEGRTTILFAPTFRGNGPRDAWYDPAWLDLPALHAIAAERDAVVIIKMHPFVREPIVIPEELGDRIIDGSTSTIDVNDLLFAVDVLITDYSSIVFEFSTLGRPMLFYAPDLEEYVASRDFYIPFGSFVPGRIVRTFDALLDALRRDDFEQDKVAAFAARHFAHLDGNSTDRVIDEVILAR